MAYSGLVFPFRHNWDDGRNSGILERWAGLDQVLPRLDGTEQRIQTRTRPRRQLEYRITPLEPNTRAYLDNWLRANQGRECMLPVWTEQQRIPAAVSIGATTLAADTAWRDFDDGSHVMLYANPWKWEILEIDTVSSGSIDLLGATEQAWERWEGWIIPARLGFVQRSPSFLTVTPSASTERVAVIFHEREISLNRFDTSTPTQYRSLDTLQFEHAKGEEEGTHEGKFAEFDGGASGFVYDNLEPQADDVLPFSRLLTDRAKIASMLGWVLRRKGRRVPFWLPSYQKDFPIISATFGISGVVRYKANGFLDYFFDRPGYRDVVLIPIKDVQGHTIGEHVYRRIEDCDLFAAGVEQLHFSTAAYSSFSDTNMMICQNLFCRLESNEQEFFWESDQAIRLPLRFRRLQADV